MNKRIYKILDIILLTLWCVFMSIRVHYPKQYHPMNPYFFTLVILLIIDLIVLRIKKVYNEDEVFLHFIRGALFMSPIVVAAISFALK